MNNHKVIALDNFNRANAANLGANWSVGLSGNIPEILSNQVANRVANANNDAFWNTQLFDNNQYAQALLVQRNTGVDDFSGVAVRMNGSDYVAFRLRQSSGQIEIAWYNGGAFTILTTDSGSTGDPAGKLMTLEVIGTTYYAYLNGVLVLQVTDSRPPASGSPGMILWGTTAGQSLWDNFEAGIIPSPTGLGVVRGIKYFSIDVMKETKDTVNDQPPDSDIENLTNAISQGLRPTHIAVSMPLDKQNDMLNNGNFPTPRTIDANFKMWFDTIHNAGCKVMYRGTFCNMENIYNFPYLPSADPGFIPQGSAASAATDGETTWLGKMYQAILRIGSNFKPGDIFAPFPEQTSYVFGSPANSFLSTTPSIQSNYTTFFQDVKTVADAAFAKLNISGVVTGFSSNNYSEIRSGYLQQGVFDTGQIVSLDYYGDYNSDGVQPYQYYVDIQAVTQSKGYPAFWQEWGDLQTDNEDYQTRLDYFDAVCAQIAQMVNDGFLIGFNYWGGWAGQNTSILDQNADGTYVLNGQGVILAKYFNPSPQAVKNFVSGVGHSQRSRWEIQAWINGQLFADLTGIAQDRHFLLTRNDSDQIDFSMNLDALEAYATKLKINSQDILQKGITEIRFLRNGVVMSAGYITYWDVELAADRKITVQCRGWLELLKYRFSNNQWSNMTALQIFQAEVNASQALTFGNLGFVFGLLPASDATNLFGVKTYQDKPLYDLVTDFTKEDNGFDFEITWDKKINIYYPVMGTIRQDIVFSYPGNIKDLKISNDVTKWGNQFISRGSQGLDDVIANDSPSQQKYGLMQAIAHFSDVDNQQQLDDLTQTELDEFKDGVILHDVQMDGSISPQTGSYRLGDQVRNSVTNLLKLYAGVNNFFRIDKIDVKIGKDDDETVEVSTNSPT
jgi:hypothetical protein